MNKPAAIAANLVDVRNIAAHKCVRLEIHVPVEQAGMVMDAFGWPTAVNPSDPWLSRASIQRRRPMSSLRKHEEAGTNLAFRSKPESAAKTKSSGASCGSKRES